MVEIIAGRKGKGKTKFLLEKANNAVLTTHGTICYVDKSTKHMYELSNQVRLINIFDYPVRSYEAFIGFVSGLVAQDYDLDQIYFDSFLTISGLEESDADIAAAVETLEKISKAYNVNFVLSISLDEADLPDDIKKYIVISL